MADCFDKSDCGSEFDLTNTNDTQLVNSVVQESLNIGGADLNVFKLLGIHEQGKLVDLTGNGSPISSGSYPDYPATNAFTKETPEWRSVAKGIKVTQEGYLGYDFGVIKLDNGRAKYGIDTQENHHITTIKITQSKVKENRVTKARVEYSKDGIKWFGAAIVDLPDDDNANEMSFKTSSPARFWRLRPIAFNGGANDYWEVCSLQLFDYKATRLDVLQDEMGFLESRDRDYSDESITLKGNYDLIDVQTELTRFGIELPSQQYYITVNFSDAVLKLGRPLLIGDIIEMPSEKQYSRDMEEVKKYLEVTDIGWSTDGYSPGWTPTLIRVIAQPMLATQETMDVIGDFAPMVDSMGFLDIDDSQHTDLTDTNNTVEASAHTQVPESGADTSEVTFVSDEVIEDALEQDVDLRRLRTNPQALYVEDAMPPNGASYTEGKTLPSNPADGAYHRLTYPDVKDDIPPRLYKYSLAKGRWIYLETDMRYKYNNVKPSLQAALSSDTRVANDEIPK